MGKKHGRTQTPSRRPKTLRESFSLNDSFLRERVHKRLSKVWIWEILTIASADDIVYS